MKTAPSYRSKDEDEDDDISVRTDQTTLPSSNRRRITSTAAVQAAVTEHLNPLKAFMDRHEMGYYWGGFLLALIHLANEFTTLTVNRVRGMFQAYADVASTPIELDHHFDQIVFHLNPSPLATAARSVLQSMHNSVRGNAPGNRARNQPGGVPGLQGADDGSASFDGSSIPSRNDSADRRTRRNMGPTDPLLQQQQNQMLVNLGGFQPGTSLATMTNPIGPAAAASTSNSPFAAAAVGAVNTATQPQRTTEGFPRAPHRVPNLGELGGGAVNENSGNLGAPGSSSAEGSNGPIFWDASSSKKS